MSQASDQAKGKGPGTWRRVALIAICVVLAALSAEIIYRRLAVGQIPTQFSGGLVYALVALNAVYIVWAVRRVRLK